MIPIVETGAAAQRRRRSPVASLEGGSRLAGTVAAAIREEEAPAEGGFPREHGELRSLGYAGISELLRFRPKVGQLASPS